MARREVKKKEEILKDKPESLMMVLKAGSQFILVILGIIGAALSIFSEGGLLGVFLDKLTNLDGDIFIGIALTLVVLYFIKTWLEKTTGKSSAVIMGNMALYGMMALGLFFFYRLLTMGSFTG